MIWQRRSDILKQSWRGNIISIYYPPKHLFSVFEIVQFVYVCICKHHAYEMPASAPIEVYWTLSIDCRRKCQQKKAHKASIQ